MPKFNDFQWEEEDTTTKNEDATKSSSEFQALLDSEPLEVMELRKGEQVSGTIVSIPSESNDVLVELSKSQTAVIDKQDILEEDGTLQKAPGDTILAYVMSLSGGIQLSSSLGKSQQAERDLELAKDSRMPVKGKVTGDVKGGFEVLVFGKTAFCPVSQMDTTYIENKADYIGKDFEFLITKLENKGRNIVVSREQLLKEKAKERLSVLKKDLADGRDLILEGRVASLKDFGAIIDLSALTGFLHISEISHARIQRPSDVLSIGEKVRVQVLSIEEQEGKTRISLSMRSIAQDPWSIVHEEFKELESYKGRVISLSKHGAFVELKPGLDGLIHLSEMSFEKRVLKAEDVVAVGDEVTVRILEIDSEKRRISLSLKDASKDPWKDIASLSGQTVTGKVDKLKGFGALVEVSKGVYGLLPLKTLKAVHKEGYRRFASPPKEIEVVVSKIDFEERKILLSLPQMASEDDHEDFKSYILDKSKQVKSQPATGTFGKLLAQKLKDR